MSRRGVAHSPPRRPEPIGVRDHHDRLDTRAEVRGARGVLNVRRVAAVGGPEERPSDRAKTINTDLLPRAASGPDSIGRTIAEQRRDR